MNADPFSAADQFPLTLAVFGVEQHTVVRFEIGGLWVYGTASLAAGVCVVVELILEIGNTK